MTLMSVLLTGVAGAAMVSSPAAPSATVWRFHADHVLGTSFDMAVAAPTQGQALIAHAAALAEIDRLDAVLSTWRADSEISGLNRGEGGAASPDLLAVLKASEAWRQATDGAFDARIGAVDAAWRAGSPPSAPTKDMAKGPVGFDGRSVAKPAGLAFTVDGLAKGYVIDQALAAARRASPGLTGAMIDIGGDVGCWGSDGCGAGWRVGVADPHDLADNGAPAAVLTLTDGAVAYSGRGLRDHVVEGRAHSHLIDPADGLPTRATLAAAVTAPRAVDADALSTAFSILPPPRSLAIANALPGVEALIVDADGVRHASDGWNALTGEAAAPRTQVASLGAMAMAAAGAAWPAGFTVDVAYEIPKIDAGDYKKPYLIIWVTNAEKQAVRTLLVMGDKAKWQEDNYIWFRRVGRKNPGMVEAVAKPTRAPGRYTAVWDGKDDAGKMLPQGQYTVHIEAAREHGGHSYKSLTLDLGAARVEQSLPAQDELGAIKVGYGKRK